jgi:hypothetical protein
MGNPGAGLLRAGRGVTLAVCCGALALLGHVSGGAPAPPLSAFLTVTALLGAAFAVLAGRRRQFRHILAVALGAQVAFHLAFQLTAAHSADHLGVTGAVGPLAFWDPLTAAGHAAAAVVMSALVARGEDVVWALYHLLGLVRLPLPVAPEAWPLVRPLPVRVEEPRPEEWLWARVHPRRGPPGGCAG